jgi:hypothetical protein
MRNAVGIFELAVSRKPIEHEGESLVAFHITRAFEIFIKHCADQIPGRRDKARRACLIRKLPADQPVVIGEIDIHLHIQRSACRCRCEARRKARRNGGCS